MAKLGVCCHYCRYGNGSYFNLIDGYWRPSTLNRFIFLTVFGIFCGCSNASPWRVDSISAGDTCFNSTRLRYTSSETYPSITFEMLKIGNEVDAFLSLTRFRLSPDCTRLLLTIKGIAYEEAIIPHEGLMRVRLPQAATQRLIQALQEGDQVSILLDGFEENLDPNQFSSSFAKFLGEGTFFQNLLKGPLP